MIPSNNNKVYSWTWANNVLLNFQQRYGRVCALFSIIYKLPDKEIIYWIRACQPRWENYKRAVKIIDKRSEKLRYPQDERLIRQCVDWIMTQQYLDLFPEKTSHKTHINNTRSS